MRRWKVHWTVDEQVGSGRGVRSRVVRLQHQRGVQAGHGEKVMLEPRLEGGERTN